MKKLFVRILNCLFLYTFEQYWDLYTEFDRLKKSYESIKMQNDSLWEEVLRSRMENLSGSAVYDDVVKKSIG